jgi:hypothetical protein
MLMHDTLKNNYNVIQKMIDFILQQPKGYYFFKLFVWIWFMVTTNPQVI